MTDNDTVLFENLDPEQQDILLTAMKNSGMSTDIFTKLNDQMRGHRLRSLAFCATNRSNELVSGLRPRNLPEFSNLQAISQH